MRDFLAYFGKAGIPLLIVANFVVAGLIVHMSAGALAGRAILGPAAASSATEVALHILEMDGDEDDFCGICDEEPGEEGQPGTHRFLHYPEVECTSETILAENQSCRKCKGNGSTHVWCHSLPDLAGMCNTHSQCGGAMAAVVDEILESDADLLAKRSALRDLIAGNENAVRFIAPAARLEVLTCEGNVLKDWTLDGNLLTGDIG